MARQKLHDEIGEGASVLIDAVKRLFLVHAAQMTESRTGSIDEYQVAHVDEAVLIVDHAVGSGRHVPVVRGHHALGAERSHVQPYGR